MKTALRKKIVAEELRVKERVLQIIINFEPNCTE